MLLLLQKAKNLEKKKTDLLQKEAKHQQNENILSKHTRMLENRKKLYDLLPDWPDSDSNESSDLSSDQSKGDELNSELNSSLDENRRKETPRVLSPFQQQLVPSLSEDNECCSSRQQENPKLQNKRPKLVLDHIYIILITPVTILYQFEKL
ncbi:uncharacterized protein LOC122504095 [Leptopilina heterotoma]|uniref:uncharacterized protein LOC122504095 n=1 Tax=Leptopilina heterotoma TaxID=63436 RepID=UPI001CAA2D32|nr:uncharacterized protein LOC122504095 [Leptopilina heterotoma]